ncbi:phosphotransferase [Streptomyces sp. N2-109]|uniref:Phosphotransferase n=1 Tax=Streptomyces gossypii TaxID=2883101 RepID=A0ABT2JME8_9ACTN|nr:phosphotransferase [Streptomyces gossypii]MCT2589056.1 phosphotransferase [Streptomyces gossypii]
MQPSPPRLPAHTLSTVLTRYRAGEPLSCEPISLGLLNRGYRLATTRGHFFLKHHLDTDPADPGPLEAQHRATARLGALGLPVVPPVAAPDGHTVTVVGRRCYALHPWIEGRHWHGDQLTGGQCHRLGSLLGQVHTRLQQVLPPAPATPAATSGPYGGTAGGGAAGSAVGDGLASADPDETETVIDGLLARVRDRRARDGFDELAEHRLLERRRMLRRYAGCRPHPGAAPVAGWVHGDFHPLNLLYRDTVPGGPSEPVALVDWDRLAVQPRAEEAVRGAAIFFVRPDGTMDLAKVRSYARAYRVCATASPGELSAAVHRVWWERLNDFWMLRWRYELRDGRADPQFAAAAALVVWWTRQYEAVRDAFCG